MPKPRRKLPSSTVAAALTFRPASKVWHRISKAYQTRLTPQAAYGLRKIISSYYSQIQWEIAAPDVLGALDQVRNIRRAANKLLKALSEHGETRSTKITFDHLLGHSHAARSEIEKHWIPYSVRFEDDDSGDDDQRPLVHGISKWLWFEREITLFAAAGLITAREMEKLGPIFFRDGVAWDNFVCDLLEWAKSNAYPTSCTMLPLGESPPFIRLVEQIQKEIAPQFRRHCHSAEALSMAIRRARRARTKALR